ncbi:MAG: hypothetical protein AAF420_13850, partial [Pseudomonadota bacterium]
MNVNRESTSPINSAVYIVATDIPNQFQDAFNDWYDTEHLADVSDKPGVHSGMRYFANAGSPQFVAMYELTSLATVESPEFERLDTHPSEWSLRVSPRVIGVNTQRYLAELEWRTDSFALGAQFPQELSIECLNQRPDTDSLGKFTQSPNNSFARLYRVHEGNAAFL